MDKVGVMKVATVKKRLYSFSITLTKDDLKQFIFTMQQSATLFLPVSLLTNKLKYTIKYFTN